MLPVSVSHTFSNAHTIPPPPPHHPNRIYCVASSTASSSSSSSSPFRPNTNTHKAKPKKKKIRFSGFAACGGGGVAEQCSCVRIAQTRTQCVITCAESTRARGFWGGVGDDDGCAGGLRGFAWFNAKENYYPIVRRKTLATESEQ